MAEKIAIKIPDTEQEGTQSVIERWFKQPGDSVTEFEPLLELSTDKVSMEISAPAGGILSEIRKNAGEAVKPGDVVGYISPKAVGETVSSAPKEERTPPKVSKTTAGGPPMRLSPAVKRLIKQYSLDISQIRGSGLGGRVTFKDVRNYLEARDTQEPQTFVARSETPTPYRAEPAAGPLKSRKIPHSQMRKSIASHMVESMLRTAPHVTAIFDADFSAIMAHRQKHKEEFLQRGVRLTFTAYFVDAAVKALQAIPEVNSRWHEDALELFSDCNIGIATALDNGLIVPVLHKAQDLHLFGIADRLQDLTTRAREGRLAPSEVQNGTFTITNHGVSGSLIATPIINQPQSAILGIGKMEYRYVVEEQAGKLLPQIKPMAYVTLTIDHRALDGFTANKFLTRFVAALQEW